MLCAGALIEAFSVQPEEMRIKVVRALAHESSSNAWAVLIHALDDPSSVVRINAARSLARCNPASLDEVARLRNDPSPEVRQEVVHLMAEMAVRLSQSGNVAHVQLAVRHIQHLPDREAARVLSVALSNPSSEARLAALHVICEMKQRMAILLLPPSPLPPEKRAQLAFDLAETGEKGGDLIRLLLQDPDQDVRAAAAQNLGPTLGRKGLPDLIRAITFEKNSRAMWKMIETLETLVEDRTRIVLNILKRSPYPRTRKLILTATDNWPAQTRFVFLKWVLTNDPHPRLRRLALELASDLPGRRLKTMLLQQGLNDPNPLVVEKARNLLRLYAARTVHPQNDGGLKEPELAVRIIESGLGMR